MEVGSSDHPPTHAICSREIAAVTNWTDLEWQVCSLSSLSSSTDSVAFEFHTQDAYKVSGAIITLSLSCERVFFEAQRQWSKRLSNEVGLSSIFSHWNWFPDGGFVNACRWLTDGWVQWRLDRRYSGAFLRCGQTSKIESSNMVNEHRYLSGILYLKSWSL